MSQKLLVIIIVALIVVGGAAIFLIKPSNKNVEKNVVPSGDNGDWCKPQGSSVVGVNLDMIGWEEYRGKTWCHARGELNGQPTDHYIKDKDGTEFWQVNTINNMKVETHVWNSGNCNEVYVDGVKSGELSAGCVVP